MTSTSPAARRTSAARGRPWFVGNAVVAWTGVLLQLVLSAGGFYPSGETVPSQLGYANAAGLAGALGRVIDYASYFTILSNIVVAVVVTVLARHPGRDTPLLRVLRLDSLLMIVITGLVYAVVLAPTAHNTGWQVVGNFFVHQATPVLTVVVWLVVGPRGWIRWSTIPLAMILPLVWLAYTLTRGVVIGGYPYPFLDVVRHGYGQVAINVLGVLVLGVVVAVILLGVDRLLPGPRPTRRS
jgi:hypothetical protein